ncbi:MAG: polysaccharide biosynthesis/export family protein [Alphaproteobacteria bacterium]
MGQGRTKFAKLLLSGACVIALLSGCTDTDHYTPLASIKADPPPVQAARAAYRIGPGDELEIKFFFAPELNDRMTVRPDGKISIMFAQEVQAAGLTTERLAHNIRAILAPHVKQLDLVVVVRSFASHKVYVGGEVTKPGAVPLTGDESLLQVMAEAGWMTPMGSKTVVVVRRDAGGTEKVYPVDVAQLESGEDMTQNILMQAGDLILVPPSDAVISDRWVDQNIRQLLPFTPTAGMSYNINTAPIQ